jgi:hypothetical protein
MHNCKLIFLFITMSTFLSSSIFADELRVLIISIPGHIIASNHEAGQALINVGVNHGVRSGDTIIIMKDGAEVVKGTVRNAFTDSAKIIFKTGHPEIKDNLEIKAIPKPETSLTKLKRIFREKFSGSVTTGVNYYGLGGANFKTFRQKGFHFFEDVDLSYRDQVKDKYDIEADIQLSLSDDPYQQPETFSGKHLRLAVKEKDDKYGFIFGDEYTYFSHYTMSQSLKGIKSYYQQESKYGASRITALFGTPKHRWEDFYKNLENEPFTRFVSGARMEHKFQDRASAGLNFVDSRDEGGTGSDNTTAVHNDVVSMDGDLHLFEQRLNAKGEFAYAWTDTDKKSKVETNGDKAYRIDVDALLTDFELFQNRTFYRFERTGQNFSALSGILKSDRQENYVRHKMDVGHYVTAKYQFTRFWGNLKDGATTTTKTIKNDIDVTIRPLPKHPQTEIRTDLYVTQRESVDDTTTDNDTESFHIELKSEIQKIIGWLGLRLEDKKDNVTPGNKRRNRAIDFGARSRFSLGSIRLSPKASFEIATDKAPSTQDESKMVLFRIGTDVHTRDLELRVNYGFRHENNQIVNDNQRRQTFRVETRYFVLGDPSRIASLEWVREDFDNKNVTKDFDETIMVAKYTQYFQ